MDTPFGVISTAPRLKLGIPACRRGRSLLEFAPVLEARRRGRGTPPSDPAAPPPGWIGLPQLYPAGV